MLAGAYGLGWSGVALLLLGAFPAPTHAQSAVYFAGLQTTVGSGLSSPAGVAVDGAGDVFVADSANNVVEVPAGCSSSWCQFTVGGGLNTPTGVAVDGAGDVFIADTDNNRVVEVPAGCTSSSCQTTVGFGLSVPSGVAVDGAGDVFIADSGNDRVVKVPAGCSSSSCQFTVASSGLAQPLGVAVDGAGDVFIADANNNRVVEVPAGCSSSSCQTTVGFGLGFPGAVAVDGAGDVFIADTFNNRVVEVPAGCSSSSCQLTVGSGLAQPLGVAVDGVGDVFIADSSNSRVVEVESISVNFGSVDVGSSNAITLTYNIFDSVTLGSTVKVVTQGAASLDFTATSTTCTGRQAAGTTCTVRVEFAPRAPGVREGGVQILVGLKNGSNGPPLLTTLVHGIGVGPALAFASGPQTTVGSGLNYPNGAAVDAVGNVFIADTGNNRVVEVPTGCSSSSCQITVGFGLDFPFGVAVDGAGDVFIADTNNSRVVKEPAGGDEQTTVGSGLNSPFAVAVDAAGDVFIADTSNSRVVKVPAGGGTQTTVGSGLNTPYGVAVDGAGDVFIADTGNNRIVKVPSLGGPQSTVESGLNNPLDVAVDGAGDVFIGDTYNNRVVEVHAGGGAQTTVGSGLNTPSGVAVDGAGDVFIADSNNNRVVEVQDSMASPLTFPATPQGGASPPQTVTVQNIGNAALTFVGLASSTNFVVDAGATTCTSQSSLAVGASCNVGVVCSPTATGSLTGTLTLTDNALNRSGATQTVALSCVGTASSVQVTLGTSPVGLSFTVDGTTYTSTQTLAWEPGSLHTISTTSPQADTPGTQYVFNNWSDGGGIAHAVTAPATATTYTATFVAAPTVTITPTSLSFGNQAVGTTSAAKTLTLKNDSTLTLNIASITPSANFAVSSTCGATLAGGKTCKVSVTFSPTGLGAVAGALTFNDNAANSPQTVALSGTGIVDAELTPASETYPNTTVGATSAAKTFTLTNEQNVALTGIAISTTEDFAVSATTCTTSLAAKSKCTISVTFTPTATGTTTGQLIVHDSGSNSPQASNLKGTGKQDRKLVHSSNTSSTRVFSIG